MLRIQPKRSRVAFLLLAAVVLPGCAGHHVNLWPIYSRESRPISTEQGPQVRTSVEALYPFFAMEREPGRHYHALRPLYNYESKDGGASARVQYLWPLGLHRTRRGKSWQHRVLPLFDHSVTRRPSGVRTVHGLLFPIVFWGSSPPGGAYFAVFPLGGVTRDVLGDKFSFVLFPLFSYYRKGEYRRRDIVWPFFSFGGSSDGKHSLLRVWPLYIHRSRKGRCDRYYVLWPFFAWGRENMAGKYPVSYWNFFPLYGRKVMRDAEGRTVASLDYGFLVSLRRDNRPGQRAREWSLLLGLAKFSRTPKAREFRIWPFYWRVLTYSSGKDGPQRKRCRYRVLWPIIWVDADDREERVSKRDVIVAPFYWQYRRRYAASDGSRGETSRKTTLWPLFTHQRERGGERHFWVLSHGWNDSTEGFKRNYRAFFDFIQYHSRPDGEKETRLFWKLYHHKRGSKGRYLSLFSLFTYDGRKELGEEKSFSALFGLVKYSWREQGGRWRLFFIPLGGGNPPAGGDDDG